MKTSRGCRGVFGLRLSRALVLAIWHPTCKHRQGMPPRSATVDSGQPALSSSEAAAFLTSVRLATDDVSKRTGDSSQRRLLGPLQLPALAVAFAGLVATTSPVAAERAPLSTEELLEEADLVVVADVVSTSVGTERSHHERGFGNYDWTIDLSLRISQVEKGPWKGDEVVVARCFRIKSRKSMVEFMTPSGNDPIPGVGVAVRAYLYRRDAVWRVVFPNGLQPISDHTVLASGAAMRGLSLPRYTYWLPLEFWGCGLVVATVIFFVAVLWRRWRRRRRANA